MTVRLIRGRLVVSSPFCSGNRSNKSFQAHPWLAIDRDYKIFRCPICGAKGEA